jgi:hypothetical protein
LKQSISNPLQLKIIERNEAYDYIRQLRALDQASIDTKVSCDNEKSTCLFLIVLFDGLALAYHWMLITDSPARTILEKCSNDVLMFRYFHWCHDQSLLLHVEKFIKDGID